MGTKDVNKDRKNYELDEQSMGRDDNRQLDRPLNDIRDDVKHDKNPIKPQEGMPKDNHRPENDNVEPDAQEGVWDDKSADER